jgi:hypothetical protein
VGVTLIKARDYVHAVAFSERTEVLGRRSGNRFRDVFVSRPVGTDKCYGLAENDEVRFCRAASAMRGSYSQQFPWGESPVGL